MSELCLLPRLCKEQATDLGVGYQLVTFHCSLLQRLGFGVSTKYVDLASKVRQSLCLPNSAPNYRWFSLACCEMTKITTAGWVFHNNSGVSFSWAKWIQFFKSWALFRDHSSFKNVNIGNSLVVQWLGLGIFTAVAQVQSLVRELRSHKPHSQNKGINK